MWLQNRPYPHLVGQMVGEVDARIESLVEQIFQVQAIPNDWPGRTIEAVIFEVNIAGDEPGQVFYGYHCWVNGIERSATDSNYDFAYSSMTNGFNSYIAPPTIDMDVIVTFLEGVYGESAVAVRRYNVSSTGTVSVLP